MPHGSSLLLGGNLSAHKHITVVLGGVQESSYRPGPAIEGFMGLFGDVMIVKYPRRGRFSLKRVAREVLRHITFYEEVTLDGISGGAKIAQEVIRLAKKLGLKIVFRLILDSAPASIGTLRPGLRLPALASLIVPAWLLPSNLRFSWWFYGAITGAKPDELPQHAELTDSQLAALEEHHRATNERPAGSFIRETRSLIVRAPKPNPRVLRGIKAVSIGSNKDEIVSPAAFGAWNEAIEDRDTTLPRVVVESYAHADHLSAPDPWLKGYTQVFRLLGLKPIGVGA